MKKLETEKRIQRLESQIIELKRQVKKLSKGIPPYEEEKIKNPYDLSQLPKRNRK